MTRQHLADMSDQIGKILDPKFAPQIFPPSGFMRPGAFQEVDAAPAPASCWPDDVTR
jgi:hypothetical protein